jgi:small-conductance mechanosensitive channel/CRP-like cAMP-binding protein
MVPFLATWGFAVLGGALVLVAFLVNVLARGKRYRVRRALLLYVIYVALLAAEHGLRRSTSDPTVLGWADHVHVVGGLLAAFTCVELLTLALFDVLLPAVRLSLPGITTDLLVGCGYLFAAFGVLRAAGASASSVVTTSALVSGVIALGMQATLVNIVGGVALQLDGSVNVGDWIQLPDGQQGRVAAIRWRHTVLETRNWDTLIVPNATLLNQNLVILGKRTGRPLQHRMWVYFNVDFRYPPTQVIGAVTEALCAAPIEGVAVDPRPNVICYDFSKDGRESFAYYAARYWLTDLPNDDPTSSRVRTRIYTALRRAGIPLARPTSTIFVNPQESEQLREERHHGERVHAVAGIEFLQSLTPEERAFVADHLRPAPFAAGETITKQDAVAHWLYILTKGKVEVRLHHADSNETKVVATIDAPSFFGEMGMLTGAPRRADVIALSDVECYRLDKEGLARILTERPEIAQQISRTLAKRDVEFEAVVEDLDEDARRARMAHAEIRLLDRIQEFFGLERTSRI